jgi:hypothetical protein
MKSNTLLFLPFLIFSLLPSGCETENQKITATLIDHSDCKGLKSASADEVPNTQSCINYIYDGITGILSVKHVNAGFNCCPGKLTCSVGTVGDTLVITEHEQSPMCNCDCLFDLDIEVSSLPDTQYVIKVVEPYCGDQQKLIFNVDLEKEPSGSFCATRNQYPWGMP